MLLCAVIAFALMFAEQRMPRMAEFRAHLSTLVAPVQWVVSLPSEGLTWGALVLSDQGELIEENRHLREQLLMLSHRVQRMASLTAENVRLRELLDAARRSDMPYLTAELLSLDSDPFTYQMVIDRGRSDGVYAGQPVMDASGLIGQVTSVSAYTSRVLMLADASHAVPVKINRNGLRFIVQGSGRYDSLDVLHVPDTADIRQGDLLVTSGLAGRFPEGYPVARVVEVVHDPGEPFAQVRAEPVSQPERSRHFLLLFPPPPVEVSEQSLDAAIRLGNSINAARGEEDD
ncbi:rod shape-determining protein MreC [Halomonas sp. McH1-25]|nr:rod shape-determining protein MreC [Halomonas sp. McH1-25]MCP1343724.1 rod shape-determining protein MreC [Halomonas sp. FL8]MCP1360344.1 rod shape-determining protein MreC [Halomonas sp. BBD45]MCP1365928.1 rod shape-determining protein MreC [Halomonas sp. BBD48]